MPRNQAPAGLWRSGSAGKRLTCPVLRLGPLRSAPCCAVRGFARVRFGFVAQIVTRSRLPRCASSRSPSRRATPSAASAAARAPATAPTQTSARDRPTSAPRAPPAEASRRRCGPGTSRTTSPHEPGPATPMSGEASRLCRMPENTSAADGEDRCNAASSTCTVLKRNRVMAIASATTSPSRQRPLPTAGASPARTASSATSTSTNHDSVERPTPSSSHSCVRSGERFHRPSSSAVPR